MSSESSSLAEIELPELSAEVAEQIAACHDIGDHLLREFDGLCSRHDIRYFLDAGTLLGAVRHEGWIPWDDDVDIAMLRADYERLKVLAPKDLPPDLELSDPDLDPDHVTVVPRIKYLPSQLRFVDRLGIMPPERQTVVLDIFVLDAVPNRPAAVRAWFSSLRLLQLMKVLASASPQTILQAEESPRTRAVGLALRLVAGVRPMRSWQQAYTTVLLWPRRREGSDVGVPSHAGHHRTRVFPRRWFEGESTTATFDGRQYPIPNPEPYLVEMYGSDFMELPPVNKRVPHYYRKFYAKLKGREWGRPWATSSE